jgi:hypothetical protein
MGERLSAGSAPMGKHHLHLPHLPHLPRRKERVPRHERARFQPLPLPVWLRVGTTVVGWLLIGIGILGLFLPVLQGGLSLALGFALLSVASQSFHLRLRRWMGRWPRLWRRMEKFRRKLGGWLHRRSGGPPAGERAKNGARASGGES